jgi:hypothetical protein
MKKINYNSISYFLLKLVLGFVLVVFAMDIYIIINDFVGNESAIEKVDNTVRKIYNL